MPATLLLGRNLLFMAREIAELRGKVLDDEI